MNTTTDTIDTKMFEHKIFDIIDNAMSAEFFFPCYFKFAGVGRDYVKIVESAKAANMQLTATPFLRHLFSDAELSGTVYYFPEEEEYQFAVYFRVSYNHPGGGSNGLELGRLLINEKTGQFKYIER